MNADTPIDFSLILPTRERLGHFTKMLDSIAATCFNLSRVELWACVDWDDTGMLEARAEIERRYPWVKLFVTPRQDNLSTGYYNPLAMASRGRWVQVLNDDLIFTTPAWDIIGQKTLEAGHALYPDGIFYGRVHDNLNAGYSCFPILTRRAVEACGWFFHPEFRSWSADINLHQMFSHLGRVVDVPYHIEHHQLNDAVHHRVASLATYNDGCAPGEAHRVRGIIEGLAAAVDSRLKFTHQTASTDQD